MASLRGPGLAASIGLIGCGEFLDVDAYRLVDTPDGGGMGSNADASGGRPGAPVGPGGGAPDSSVQSARGTPFYTPACNACLDSTCSAELEACAADDTCAALLACLRGCREPGCWLSCAEVGGHSLRAWPLGALDTCMFSGCVEPCRTNGGNFDCSRKWRVPDLYEPNEPITVDVQVTQALLDTPFAGWTVRACGGAGDCVDSAASQVTDEFGVVTFQLRSDRSGRGYEGYFETTDPQPGPEGIQLTYRLWRDDNFNEYWDNPQEFLVDADRVAFGIFEADKGRPPPLDIGALIVTRNFDCHYFPTTGLVAEAIPLSGPAIDRPDDILVAYGGPEGTVTIPSYLAVGGPPGRYALTISLRETGEIYREFEHEIEENTFDIQSALLPEKIEF